jgi:hypothetical protein
MPNGPEIDEKKASDVPREEEQEMEGPNSIEEELQMRELKIESA